MELVDFKRRKNFILRIKRFCFFFFLSHGLSLTLLPVIHSAAHIFSKYVTGRLLEVPFLSSVCFISRTPSHLQKVSLQRIYNLLYTFHPTMK